ncbi:hypothetical protein [Bacillus cereus group sp. BfR-BA-01317]|uniref:hypothetical protein n=1 Tax=unclassified Bacillus cereus group TaxID=2750818 RepID=UPI001F5AEAFC|nr:hypothetical protein [Bacillus cereus group sp. BfR-BA-01317]
MQFFRAIDRTIRIKEDGNNNAEVVKELKIDDYEIMDGELKYRIGKKVYISQYAPFIIEGEKSTED